MAAVALVAAGCGGSSDAAGTTATTDTTAAAPIKVGLTTDVGELNDNGFNELAYNGLKRAEKELGVHGRVVESKSSADYVPNMSALARQGYNLIIGVGFAQGDAIAKAALKYPNTKFAIVDVDQADLKGKPANVQGLLFREQEVGYLVGYLAALEAKRGGANQISAVGGFKEPPVDRYIAGYKAGAQAAVPGTTVKWAYSQDWDDQAKCKELALNQIAAGSKVVFQVAGGCGLGALLADEAAEGLGHRRRRRPVLPRPAHTDERAEGRRQRGLPHLEGRPGRDVQGRRERGLRARPGRRRARHVQPEREQGGHREGGGRREADRGRHDHRHSDDGRIENMAQLSDAQRAFLQDNPFVGTVTTLRADGSPHSTVVWVDATDDAVLFNSPADGAKVRHLRADPRISLVVIDPAEMYRWVGITGTAEIVEEGADDQIDRLAKKYLGADTYPFRRPGQQRLTVRITPHQVEGIGID